MTNRPKSFDDRVIAYKPGLQKLAKRYRHKPEDRDDLVTDTIICALSTWQNFREDGRMWSWLSFCMRGIVCNEGRKSASRKGMKFVALTDVLCATRGVAPTQLNHVELGEAIRSLQNIKGGGIVLRRAMGNTLRDIGSEDGLCTSRVDQIAKSARAELRKVAA